MSETEENPFELPLTKRLDITGHELRVTALGLDKSGSRLITGSLDGRIRMHDFAAMDSMCRSFREVEPYEGQRVTGVYHLTWHPNAQHFLVTTSSWQPLIYDRDLHPESKVEFAKGWMYIRDLKKAKGHVAPINGSQWRPDVPDEFITWSQDGSVRVWRTDRIHESLHTLRPTSVTGARLRLRTSTLAHGGRTLVMGCEDGSLQLFDMRGSLVAPAKTVKKAHDVSGTLSRGDNTGDGKQIVQIVSTSYNVDAQDDPLLVTRGMDDVVKVWDMRKMIKKRPISTFTGLTCDMFGGLCVSPDQNYAVVGTTREEDTGADKKRRVAELKVLELASGEIIHSMDVGTESVGPLVWHPKINQIIAGTGGTGEAGDFAAVEGAARAPQRQITTEMPRSIVFYDEQLSDKGALMCAGRLFRKRTNRDAVISAEGKIWTPLAEEDAERAEKRLKRMVEEKQRLPKYEKRPDWSTHRPTPPSHAPVSLGQEMPTESFIHHVMRDHLNVKARPELALAGRIRKKREEQAKREAEEEQKKRAEHS